MHATRKNHLVGSIARFVGILVFSAAVLGCQDASSAPRAGSGGEVSSADAPGVLPYYSDAAFTPHWFTSPNDVPADFHAIPSFSLTDQDGNEVTEADLVGKLTVANFFFTSCPGICPMTTANMARVQAAFADNDAVVMLSHSVTPEADSVSALKEFADHTAALSSKWHLVTGARSALYNLGKNAYFADEDLGEANPDLDPAQAFLHTESFYLLDSARRIRGVYNGMNTASVTQLIEDIRTLQREPRS